MVRVAIVEDDEQYIAQLTEFLHTYTKDTGEVFDLRVFRDGQQLVFDYRAEYDILLMDVEMPNMNGLEAARQIRRQDPFVTILFVTNMAQYAIEGYSVQAKAYLLKPLNYFGFFLEMQSAVEALSRRTPSYLLVHTEDNIVKLPEGKVVYIETDGHELIFHTTDGTVYRTRSSMKELDGKLRDRAFARPSVSYLVNLAHVTSISGDTVLADGVPIPLSRGKRKEFLAALTEYVGRR